MISELRDSAYAQSIQLRSEYDPHPRFNAGTFKTAPEAAKKPTLEMIAGFQTNAEASAAQSRG